jgi:hypothetical protein
MRTPSAYDRGAWELGNYLFVVPVKWLWSVEDLEEHGSEVFYIQLYGKNDGGAEIISDISWQRKLPV